MCLPFALWFVISLLLYVPNLPGPVNLSRVLYTCEKLPPKCSCPMCNHLLYSRLIKERSSRDHLKCHL